MGSKKKTDIPQPPPPPPIHTLPKQGSVPLKVKSSPPAALADSADKKPSSPSPSSKPSKPPAAPKPSRLVRAFSSGTMTLPSFRKGSKNGNKKKADAKKRKSDASKAEVDKSEAGGQEEKDDDEKTPIAELREAPLWKLPGMPANRRHSSVNLDMYTTTSEQKALPGPSQTFPSDAPPRPKTPPPAMPCHLKTRPAIPARPKSPPNLPARPKTPPKPPARPETPPKPQACPKTPSNLPARPKTPPNTPACPETPPSPPARPKTSSDITSQSEALVTALSATQPLRAPLSVNDLPTIVEVNTPTPEGRLLHSASADAIMSLPDSMLTETGQPPATSTPIPEDEEIIEDATAMEDGSSDKLSESLTDMSSAVSEKPPSRKVSDNAPTSTVVSIRQLVRKHSTAFPLHIKVLQGYCSENSEINMSTDDIYNIHSIKHTKVVTIRDEDQITYRIPLASAVKFGLIYNPINKYEEGLNGYLFDRVTEIMALPSPPKVVCAIKAFEGPDEKSSIEENEVLIIKQVQKSKFKKVKRGIKVFSLLTKSEKFLQDDCHVKFSTKPSLVRMPLPDLLESVPHPFPSQAVMYSTSDNPSYLKSLPGTHSRVVTMCDCTIETSLVASAADDEEDNQDTSVSKDSEHADQLNEEKQALFNIPLDEEIAEIEVAVLDIEETDGKPNHLQEDPALQSSDDSKLQPIASPDTLQSETTDDTQATPPPQAVEQDSSTAGGTKVEPPYVNISQSLNMLHEIESQNKDEDSKDGYDTVGLHLLKGQPGFDFEPEPQPPSPEDIESEYDSIGFEKFGISDPRLSSMIENLENISQHLGDRISTLESKEPPAELTMMQSMLEKLSVKLESVDTQLSTLASAPLPQPQAVEQPPPSVEQTQQPAATQQATSSASTTPAQPVESSPEANKEYLCTLDEGQMLMLLDAMDLSQYRENFQREHVTGEVLVECDDSVLQQELGITSKIHRIRLMKIVTGQRSVRDYLK